MKQNNTNKLMTILVGVLLVLVYFLWQQNSSLQSQLEIALSTSEKTLTVVKEEVKNITPKKSYKAPVKRTVAPVKSQAPASNNQELKELQKMLGDLMKLKEGLE